MNRMHQETKSSSRVLKSYFLLSYKQYFSINIAGMGIGDGWMSPYHNAQYGDFLYQVGLVDEKQRDECLAMESETQSLIEAGELWGLIAI